MSTILINKEDAMRVFSDMSEEQREVVEKIIPKRFLVPDDVRNRVRTFIDACEEIGKDHDFVRTFAATITGLRGCHDYQDVLSYLRLRIIVCALNDGWDSRQYMDQRGFGPKYLTMDEETYEKLSAYEKELCVKLGKGGDCLPPYARVHSTPLSFGNALALRTPTLATYAGRQFAREYISLLFRYNVE